MRLLLIALLSVAPLFALGEKSTTMQANFIQTITDDKNSTITYEGTMSAKRPNMAMWHYLKPVDKSIYITANEVTIVEPELEQAIIKHLANTIDILAILASAKKVGKNSYLALYGDKEYQVHIRNDIIENITFQDAFDNTVQIIFSKQKINKKILNSVYEAVIPEDFDIIED